MSTSEDESDLSLDSVFTVSFLTLGYRAKSLTIYFLAGACQAAVTRTYDRCLQP